MIKKYRLITIKEFVEIYGDVNHITLNNLIYNKDLFIDEDFTFEVDIELVRDGDGDIDIRKIPEFKGSHYRCGKNYIIDQIIVEIKEDTKFKGINIKTFKLIRAGGLLTAIGTFFYWKFKK